MLLICFRIAHLRQKLQKIRRSHRSAGGFAETAETLRSRGSSVILLACTELSLIKKECLTGAGYLDVMEVLAAKAVEECGSLRPKYRELIT